MKSPLLLLVFLSCSVLLFAQNRELEVEPNHSTLGFRISIAGFTEVTGKFTDYNIEASIDPEDFTKSRFSADIQAASINTGIPDRDAHLASADFFDAGQFPSITFSTDSIRQVNYANFIASGQFSMHGISRPIELPFTIIKKDGNTWGIKIRTTVNRIEFGVGTSFVHSSMPDFLAKEVQVEIDFWTRKKKKK